MEAHADKYGRARRGVDLGQLATSFCALPGAEGARGAVVFEVLNPAGASAPIATVGIVLETSFRIVGPAVTRLI